MACADCYKAENLVLDENTNDTFAIQKQDIRIHLIAFIHPIEKKKAVQKANAKNNSVVKRERKRIEDADRDAIKLENSVKKN